MQNDKYLPPNPPSYGFVSAPPEPAQNYPPQGYPQHGYPPQGHPQPGYPPQNFSPPPQNFGPTPPQNYGPPPPQTLPSSTIVVQGGWYSRNQRNKPQSNAAGAAALIFLSGGMNIAWSIGFRGTLLAGVPKHTSVAWFIGAIIGAFLSCLLANKVPKKIVFCFSSVLVIIGGILFAATQYNVQAIEAGLYLDGIANGLVFAPTMALIGEVAVPYMRGSIAASMEQMCYMLGFFIQIVYVTSWNNYDYYMNSFNAQQLHGVLSAVYGLIGLIIAAILCIESPVIMLANGEEQQAIDALRRLQRPYTTTTETYQQLEEHKRYLAQNKDLSTSQSIIQALPAFLRLSYLRALNAMSLSALMYYALLISVLTSYSVYSYTWQFVVFGICRWLGTLITSFCMESAGRKKPTLLGLMVSGGMAFGMGSILHSLTLGNVDALFVLICIFQLFAGVAFTASSAYLTEAYPLNVKQPFIGSTYIVEMLIFIIISCVKYSVQGHAIFFYFVGAFYLSGFLLGFLVLPETRRTTLRESQDKFKGLVSRSF